MSKDMTTGAPWKVILIFCIPMLLGNVFQQFYNMVDTIIVGRYVGENALAAVGSTGSIVFLVLGFAQGIAGGFGVWAAQAFGARDYRVLRSYVATSILLGVAVSILLSVLTVSCARPLLLLMQTPDNIIADAARYVIIIFAGIIATMFYNISAGILRAVGDSKTPLYFLIIASVLNIILDLFFIINLNQGVAGAAYATVLSQGVSAVLCLEFMFRKFHFLRLTKIDWQIRLKTAIKLLNVGLPMALQFSITAVGVMVMQAAINSFGSTVVASYTAASKVQQLATQPMVTLGTAMATYAGQNFGASRYDRLKEGAIAAVKIAVGVTLFAMAMVWLIGEPFMRLFCENPSEEMLSYGMKFLHIVSFFFLPLAILFVFRNVLQGIGRGLVPLLAGVAEMVMRVWVAFFLAKPFGYTGICMADPAAWIGAAVPLCIAYLYHQNLWKKKGFLIRG